MLQSGFGFALTAGTRRPLRSLLAEHGPADVSHDADAVLEAWLLSGFQGNSSSSINASDDDGKLLAYSDSAAADSSGSSYCKKRIFNKSSLAPSMPPLRHSAAEAQRGPEG